MGYFHATRLCRPLVAARAPGSRATPPLAEDRSPSHEPPPRRDRGDRHRARRSHARAVPQGGGRRRASPVLVGGVIWTITAGIDRGITWAFVGGLVLDSLLAASARRVGVRPPRSGRRSGPHRAAGPAPPTRRAGRRRPVLSLVYSVLILSLTSAMQPGARRPDPSSLFIPGAIYDAIGMFGDVPSVRPRRDAARPSRSADERRVARGEPDLDGRPVPAPSRLRFLAFGLASCSARARSRRACSRSRWPAGRRHIPRSRPARAPSSRRCPRRAGIIYDRDGTPLVSNVASYSVKIRPLDLPGSRRDEVVRPLAALLSADPADINIAIDSNPGSRYDPVRVAQDVDPNVPRSSPSRARSCPASRWSSRRAGLRHRALFSHILGYTGTDQRRGARRPQGGRLPARTTCSGAPASRRPTRRCSGASTASRRSRRDAAGRRDPGAAHRAPAGRREARSG